jgi:hypothetical protein
MFRLSDLVLAIFDPDRILAERCGLNPNYLDISKHICFEDSNFDTIGGFSVYCWMYLSISTMPDRAALSSNHNNSPSG